MRRLVVVMLSIHGSIIGAQTPGLSNVNTTGCSGFYDLDFDPWEFDRYGLFFTASSTFSLYPAGTYTGPDAIKEYVKFASDESPFVDSFLVLPGSVALLKSVTPDQSCVFTALGHRRYLLSARYAGGEAVHVATMATVTYVPSSHKIASIALYYERPFMQFVFDSIRTRESAHFICDTLRDTCPSAGVDTWNHNNLTSYDDCIDRFERLPAFDDGPDLAASASMGGGFDGNSASCRLLHSFLASLNTDHCAHLSFVPMADPDGKIKCQTSKRLHETQFFDAIDFENFNKFKDVAEYPIADGYKLMDRCHYDYYRAKLWLIPRPYWAEWRDAQAEKMGWWEVPPLEHMSDPMFALMATWSVWVAVLILGLGSEYVVGTIITAQFSTENILIFWRAVQFTFPLFVTIALVSHSYWGLILLVLGLWKCGSPETIVFFLMAKNKSYDFLFRVRCGMNFLGTLVHHSMTSLLIVCLTTRLEYADRNLLACTLPLVVQHWCVLLNYVDTRLFIFTEVILEIIWEWEIIWQIQHYHCHSWNQIVIASSMLVAHWYLFAAGAVKMVGARLCHAPKTAPAPDGPTIRTPASRWKDALDKSKSMASQKRGLQNSSNVVYAALEAAEKNRDLEERDMVTKRERHGAFFLMKDVKEVKPAKERDAGSSVFELKPQTDAHVAIHWREHMSSGKEPAKSSGSGVVLVLGVVSAIFILGIFRIITSAPGGKYAKSAQPEIAATASAFLTYCTIRSPSVPALVALTALLCVLLPYSWRGGLPRATFLCPSFLMAVGFLFVGTPVHFFMATFLPDSADKEAAQRFFADVKRAAILFMAVHGALTLIRIKYTLTKWQALIICELSKAMYIIFLLWGFSLSESELSNPGPAFACMIAFVTILLGSSCVRVFYASKCQFDVERFNHAYFGSDSKCPMRRVHLMCMTCEKERAGSTYPTAEDAQGADHSAVSADPTAEGAEGADDAEHSAVSAPLTVEDAEGEEH